MGRIIPPEALAEGRIPVEGAHVEAGRDLLDHFFVGEDWLDSFTNREKYGVHRGLIYGSTVTGATNSRSDVDTLIVYNDHSIARNDGFQWIRSVVAEIEDEHGVYIDLHLRPDAELFGGKSQGIDRLFASHLRDVENMEEPRWSYNWPTDGLDPLFQDDPDFKTEAAKICMGFSSFKAKFFARALAARVGEPLHAMQRALELPGAFARKAVNVVPYTGQLALEGVGSNSDKAILIRGLEIADARSQFSGVSQILEYTKRLQGVDEEYNELLQSTIEGSTSLAEYKRWLDERLRDSLLSAHELSVARGEYFRMKRHEPRMSLVERSYGNKEEIDYQLRLLDGEEPEDWYY
jgi:predicted nucleotidyltransferase